MVSFGLVNVPVRMYTAVTDHDIKFHQVHAEDGGQIRYERVCSVCGRRPVDILDIARLYESPAGEKVIVSDHDLAQLPAAEKSEIQVLQFIPLNQLDPVMLDRTYNLEPAGATPRAYVLLAAALERTDRVALVHFTLRRKTRLGALRVRNRALVVQTLLWPDEIRPPLAIAARTDVKLADAEMAAAAALVDSMTDDFDPDAHTDDYQVQLQAMLDRAIATQHVDQPGSASGSSGSRDAAVDDLVEALRRSVRDATEPPP